MASDTTAKHELGLVMPHRLFRDRQFVLALLAGCGISLLVAALSVAGPSTVSLTPVQAVSLLLWYPVLEELLFRGALQGYLTTTAVGRRVLAGLSLSNLVTAALFTLLHLVYRSDVLAWLVFFPGLVFGYFRDRHGSIVGPMILHAAYNACLIPGWYLFS